MSSKSEGAHFRQTISQRNMKHSKWKKRISSLWRKAYANSYFFPFWDTNLKVWLSPYTDCNYARNTNKRFFFLPAAEDTHLQEIWCSGFYLKTFSTLFFCCFFGKREQYDIHCILTVWEWNTLKVMQQSLSDLLSMFPPKQDDLVSTNHPSYLEHRRKADPAIHANFSKLLNKVTYIFSIVQT